MPGLFYLRAGYQGISIKFLCNTLFSKQVLFCKPPFASKGSLTSMSFLGIIRYLSTEPNCFSARTVSELVSLWGKFAYNFLFSTHVLRIRLLVCFIYSRHFWVMTYSVSLVIPPRGLIGGSSLLRWVHTRTQNSRPLQASNFGTLHALMRVISFSDQKPCYHFFRVNTDLTESRFVSDGEMKR